MTRSPERSPAAAASPAVASTATSPARGTPAPAATTSPAEVSAEAPAQPIEADDGASDVASTIDDRISSYTASVASSAIDYPVEYGRRYHAFRPGSYPLPNDDAEIDRLDLSHALMVKILGSRLYLAPLEKEKVHRILDVGTGTGIWAVEMGDIFQNAEVIGNDLSAIQPPWVPPNVKFEIDDVESPWIVEKKYDYIMCRCMTSSIKDWPKLVENIYESINPGGWAEFQDLNLEYYSDDGSLTEKHHTWTWHKKFIEACELLGREPSPGKRLHGLVQDAGFENIYHKRFKVPVGPWPKDPYLKDLGMHNMVQLLNGLEGLSYRLFCGVLGWTKEELLALLVEVRKEIKGGAFHAMFDFHVAYGQKPKPSE